MRKQYDFYPTIYLNFLLSHLSEMANNLIVELGLSIYLLSE